MKKDLRAEVTANLEADIIKQWGLRPMANAVETIMAVHLPMTTITLMCEKRQANQSTDDYEVSIISTPLGVKVWFEGISDTVPPACGLSAGLLENAAMALMRDALVTGLTLEQVIDSLREAFVKLTVQS